MEELEVRGTEERPYSPIIRGHMALQLSSLKGPAFLSVGRLQR